MFENRVRRKIFGSKTDEVRGEWRTLHSGDLHGPYCLTNINRVIKTRMRWAARVARTGQVKYIQRFGGRNLRERRPLGRRRLDGRITL